MPCLENYKCLSSLSKRHRKQLKSISELPWAELLFQYLKLPLKIFARTTILLCKHVKYSSSLILFSLESLEVLLFTEKGNRSNTRSLIIQAHSPLCKYHLINSRYHCNTQNGSAQEKSEVSFFTGGESLCTTEILRVIHHASVFHCWSKSYTMGLCAPDTLRAQGPP